jgi:hypothetical protein
MPADIHPFIYIHIIAYLPRPASPQPPYVPPFANASIHAP